jgi:tetratricopeptide (TPR) repeat protein
MLIIYLVLGILLLSVVSYYLFYLSPKLDPRNKAAQFLESKRFNDAIIEYKKILENDPGDPVILYRLANVYLRIGENDKAGELFEKIVYNGKYTIEVDQLDVKKKLGKIYYFRDEIEKTFDIFMNLLTSYPGDTDSMYHVAFISLGQEEYGFAQRTFDRLCKNSKPDYEIYFGAGICSYQNQKINECVEYFVKAMEAKSDSHITHLALSFALWRKRDYSKALSYASKLAGEASEVEVKYIAMRLESILNVHLKKYDTAIKKLEEVLDITRREVMDDEMLLTLYDLGFVCVKADRIHQAESYWKALAKEKRTYRDVQNLLMTLRREMEKKDDFEIHDSIHDYVDIWMAKFFPKNFLWNVCGLKSDIQFDIKSYIVPVKMRTESAAAAIPAGFEFKNSPGVDNIDTFIKLDTETFRMIANRLVDKLGYKVDEIMNTYKDPDGVDFMAVEKTSGEKTFVWVRRWKGMSVGEIPMRNFAQMVNELKAKRGLFVTTVELTPGAEASLEQLSKVTVVRPNAVNTNLAGLI